MLKGELPPFLKHLTAINNTSMIINRADGLKRVDCSNSEKFYFMHDKPPKSLEILIAQGKSLKVIDLRGHMYINTLDISNN